MNVTETNLSLSSIKLKNGQTLFTPQDFPGTLDHFSTLSTKFVTTNKHVPHILD